MCRGRERAKDRARTKKRIAMLRVCLSVCLKMSPAPMIGETTRESSNRYNLTCLMAPKSSKIFSVSRQRRVHISTSSDKRWRTVCSCDFSIGTQQAINFVKVLPMIKKSTRRKFSTSYRRAKDTIVRRVMKRTVNELMRTDIIASAEFHSLFIIHSNNRCLIDSLAH